MPPSRAAVPGLRGTLSAARKRALESRPSLTRLTIAERAVEGLLRGVPVGRPNARGGPERIGVA